MVSVIVRRLGRAAWQVTAIATLCVLAGCSTYSLPGEEPAPVETRPVPVPPAPAPRPAPPPVDPPATSATRDILLRAESAVARGDYNDALALLERAQRIDPDDATIYLGLAQAHSARGDRVQASAMAERGLLYCASAAECEALRAYTR